MNPSATKDYELAREHMDRRDWSGALTLFRGIDRVVLDDSGQALVDGSAAYCLMRLGHGAEAADTVRAALTAELPPDVRIAFQHTLGVAFHLMGRPHDAVTLLRQVVDQALPSSELRAECWYGLGEALRATGAESDARAAFEQARAVDPASEWSQLAQVRLTAGSAYR